MKRQYCCVCLLTLLLGSCSALETLKQSSSSRDQSTQPSSPERVAPPAPASTRQEEPFYIGIDNLKIYASPRLSADTVARLPLNTKVYRSQQQNGFAYIEIGRTGQRGWVENHHLLVKPKVQAVQPSPPQSPQAPPNTPDHNALPAEPAKERSPAIGEAIHKAITPGSAEAAPPASRRQQEEQNSQPAKPKANIFDAF